VVFTDADLSRASRDGAVLFRADLSNADLRGASLRGASLVGATLETTTLDAADVIGTDVRGAKDLEPSAVANLRSRDALVDEPDS